MGAHKVGDLGESKRINAQQEVHGWTLVVSATFVYMRSVAARLPNSLVLGDGELEQDDVGEMELHSARAASIGLSHAWRWGTVSWILEPSITMHDDDTFLLENFSRTKLHAKILAASSSA